MKKLLIIMLFSGCAVMKTENTVTTTDPVSKLVTVNVEKAKVYSFGSKSLVNGFTSNKKTKTTSSTMAVENAGTETELEKLGPIIEHIAAGVVKGMK
jgi:hypothetical protein